VYTGIIHLYTGDIRTFLRKQKRRVVDYLEYAERGMRSYTWTVQRRWGFIRFILSCLLLFPLLVQTLRGMIRKPDRCWFFHPIACWATLWIYSIHVIRWKAGAHQRLSRTEWSQ